MTEKKATKSKKTEKKEVQEKNEINEVLMFTPVIETVGTRLRKVREEKKIKLSQISKALCIRESFLTALEEGEYEVFPALVYAGGFMRSYAVYLGVDEKEVMQQFHKETEYMIEKSAEVPVAPTKNVIPSKKLLFSLLILIGVGYGIIQLLNGKKEEETIVENPTAVIEVMENPVAEIEETQKQDVSIENENANSADITPVEGSVSENLTNSEETVKKEKTALVMENTEPENPFTGETYGAKEGSRVSLLATNMVWIEVKSADKVIFTRVLKKGESYNAPVLGNVATLKTGNAGAISIYLDGQFRKVLGREGHVLKDVKLVPETFID